MNRYERVKRGKVENKNVEINNNRKILDIKTTTEETNNKTIRNEKFLENHI